MSVGAAPPLDLESARRVRSASLAARRRLAVWTVENLRVETRCGIRPDSGERASVGLRIRRSARFAC